jgi:hypothetical protein
MSLDDIEITWHSMPPDVIKITWHSMPSDDIKITWHSMPTDDIMAKRKKYKRTNNDLQIIHIKLKIE